MYEYTDKVILMMKKKFIRLFSKMKSLASFDELNVIQSSKDLYKELEDIVYKSLLLIAKHAYKTHAGKILSDAQARAWVREWLNDYNPVAKYIFAHEVERKRARFVEALVVSDTKVKEIETALRYWSQMASWFAIDTTDKATLEAYKAKGVERVMWVTIDDEKRCSSCGKRHGKVYDITEVPPKPHLKCRCELMPVGKDYDG
jgi:SPP1 gp7 family putative phage head morphogenesis protein